MEGTTKNTAPMTMDLNSPMSTKDWMLTILVQCIPMVNIVMLFIWAFGDNVNLNKRNYSRAALIFMAIFMVLWIVVSVVFGLLAAALIGNAAVNSDFDYGSGFESSMSDEEFARLFDGFDQLQNTDIAPVDGTITE